jgi:tetratricopeptide (TPR) repeat protein
MPRRPCAGRWSARTMRALTCIVLLLGAPGVAAAQRDAFIDSAIAFRLSLAGTYGDEGPQILAHLDQMATSLAIWDRALELGVTDLREELAHAPAARALVLHRHLASLFVERQHLDDALAELDAAMVLALTPEETASLLLFRGLVHQAAGASHDARQDVRQAWALDPRDLITAYLAFDRDGVPASDGSAPQMDTLLELLLDALTPPRDRPIAFMEFALIEDGAADWPVFAPAAYAEGFRLFADGQYVEALERFRTAASQDPLVIDPASREPRLALGIAHVHAFQFRQAVDHFEAVATAIPGSSEARRLLARAHATEGRDAEALPHFEAAVRLAPKDERARVSLAHTLMRLERWTDAEAVLRDTIDVLPASADARLALADLYEQRERWDEAIHALEDTVALPMLAGRGALYWRLGDHYQRQQDFEAVIRMLSMSLGIAPNNDVVRRELGLAYTRLGARDNALLELLMTALMVSADAPHVLAAIGRILLESGRHAQAEAPLRRAIAADPAHAEARYVLGMVLLRLGRAGESAAHLAVFRQLLEDEREAIGHRHLADSLRHQAARHAEEGRYDLAAGVWKEIAALEPYDPEPRMAHASALALGGDATGAVAVLELAATLDGAPAGIHRELASLYERLGRTEDSIRAQATYERLRRRVLRPVP